MELIAEVVMVDVVVAVLVLKISGGYDSDSGCDSGNGVGNGSSSRL